MGRSTNTTPSPAHPSKRRLAWIAALVLGVLVAMTMASCGDDSDNASAGVGEAITTSELTKAQFLARADAACREETRAMLKQLATYQKQNPQEGTQISEQHADLIADAMLQMVESQIAAIHDLGAPAGDEEQVEAIVAAQQEAAEDVGEMEIRSFTEVTGAFTQAAKQSQDYGFTYCSNGPLPEDSTN